MRYANWLVAVATGASLSLSSASSWAQLKTGVKEDADLPKGKALGVSGDVDVPKAKGSAPGKDSAKAAPIASERRTAAEERRDARRIPVIDANAGATFRSTQLIGTNITNADGAMIGKVVDFVSDARGNILYPIVSYSGSAGFTGKLFAIPPSGLSFMAGANNTTTAQFAFDPQLLKNAPSFSSTRFPDFSDQTFVNQVKSFFADVLPNTSAAATDPTVPANGPGDRVQTQDQAGTPTRPIDPTLPANGPGDRPATANPALPRTGTQPGTTTPDTRIPGTTGTENAGFPAIPGTSTRTATTTSGSAAVGGSPAGSTIPGGTVVGATGSPASESVSVAGDVGKVNNNMMLRSGQLVGMSIQDNRGQTIGKVVDAVGDTSGNNRFAVVSLGSDGRNIVVPFRTLRFQTGAKGSSFATLRVAPGQLKNAPSFSGKEWPNFTSPEFERNFARFYDPLIDPNDYNFMHLQNGTKASTPTGSTGTGAAEAPKVGTPAPAAPRTSPTRPGAGPAAPRPGAGPMLPGPRAGAPGVPGVPALPGGGAPRAPGAAPGVHAPGAAPGGAPAGPGAGGGARISGS